MNGTFRLNCLQNSTSQFRNLTAAAFFTLAFACGGQPVNAQTLGTSSSPTRTDLVITDNNQTSASFPGGVDNFYSYILSKVKPDSTCCPGRKIFVSFVVDKDGSVRRVKVTRGLVLSKKMNAQLVKVFEEAPKWTPARQNGMQVREHFICPVMFGQKTDLVAKN